MNITSGGLVEKGLNYDEKPKNYIKIPMSSSIMGNVK